VQRASNAFFDLPLGEKMRVVRPAPDVTRGYIPLEAESVGRSQGASVSGALPGDLNESLMIGPVDVPADDPYSQARPRGGTSTPICGPSGRWNCARCTSTTSGRWARWRRS
jgi:isopenicillin N synthase-like dioxygenase